MSDSEIDFSDISERPYEPQAEPILKEHTTTLHVDAEVAAWLQSAAREDPRRINLALKRVAHRHHRSEGEPGDILSEAS